MKIPSSKSYHNNIHESGAGFTLIELVVVLGLFMMIMGVVVTLFISIVRHQKKILGQVEIVNQASYAQEHISTLLRTALPDTAGSCLSQDGVSYAGHVYLLTHFDAEAGFYQGIKFISAEHVCQEFFLGAGGVLQEIKNGAPAQDIVSSKFSVQYVRFLINGNKNLRVTFVLSIKDPAYPDSPDMILQTTISHR